MTYKECFVAVVKHNGRILREKDGAIDLPFGSEYSLLLKNLESRRSVVGVEIDGQDVLGGKKLIVFPNSTFELAGFLEGMEVKNRFKFIQKTREIVQHRGDRVDDGLIRVDFTFEKKVVSEIHNVHMHRHYYDPWYPICFPRWDYYTPVGSGGSSYTTGDDVQISNSAKGMSSAVKGINASLARNVSVENVSDPLPDEGITVKGSQTFQGFQMGHVKELEEQSSVIVIKLRGAKGKQILVEAPVYTKTKLTCPTCGKKSKSNIRFCPHCGTFLS